MWGQIFALKQRPNPKNFDFEVLAEVAVEHEKLKHIGANPNVVQCFALVTHGIQHALVPSGPKDPDKRVLGCRV